MLREGGDELNVPVEEIRVLLDRARSGELTDEEAESTLIGMGFALTARSRPLIR